MRRLVLAGLGTVSSLVLILAYPTSHQASAGTGTTSATPSSGPQVAAGSAASAAPPRYDDGEDQFESHDDEEHDDDDAGRVPATPPQSSNGQSGSSAGGSSAGGPSAGSSSTGGSSAGGSSAGSASGTTFTGGALNTRYGPVQVQITVTGGKIITVDAVRYPSSDGHSQRINSYAIPTLNGEALAAQSARIDAVSGATITSNAYVQSLQSALDAARL